MFYKDEEHYSKDVVVEYRNEGDYLEENNQVIDKFRCSNHTASLKN